MNSPAPLRSTPSRGVPSGRKTSRPSRTQQTRRRLLEAGRVLFAQHGPAAITSHTIAAEAGYAAGTFYLHFKDKHSLFHELAEEAASELEERIQTAAVGKVDAAEIMQAQAEALVGFAEEKRDLLQIIFHPGQYAGQSDSESDDFKCGIGAGILERLARGVSARRQEKLARGRARECLDSDVLAQAIVGMWAHILAWWSEDPTRATREDLIRTLTHFQLHGNRSEAGGLCGAPETDPSD